MNNLYDTMSPENVRKLCKEMLKEKISENYKLPTKPSTDGYYHLQVKTETGRRQIKAKTIEELKEKLYGKTIDQNCFETVFFKSQEEKRKYTKSEDKLASVENTINRNTSNYNRFFKETEFSVKPIAEISKEDIEEICFHNLKRYDLNKKGFFNLRGVLKGTFKFAFEQYLIMDNPYDRVNFKKFSDMLADTVDIENRCHSEENIQRILDLIHTREELQPDFFTPYALELQIVMGLRRGEVPPLEWTDVEDTYINIHKEQLTLKNSGKFRIVNHTKTHKDRKYPRTKEVDEILDKVRNAQEIYDKKSNFLFPADTEIGCISNNSVYAFYHRLCEKLNIPITRNCIIGTHSFRRNAITKTINNSDGNILLASKLYGNSPDIANKNYYIGIDLAKAKEVLER